MTPTVGDFVTDIWTSATPDERATWLARFEEQTACVRFRILALRWFYRRRDGT